MNRTTFLFSESSFIEGVGRIVDFGLNLNKYNFSESGEEADYRALKSDWYAVGDDIRKVLNDEKGK